MFKLNIIKILIYWLVNLLLCGVKVSVNYSVFITMWYQYNSTLLFK